MSILCLVLTRECKTCKLMYFNLYHGLKHMFELLIVCKTNHKNKKSMYQIIFPIATLIGRRVMEVKTEIKHFSP